MKASALILTFNEEENLPNCLRALGWCDDVLILDSGSIDTTVEIGKQWGARVLTRPFDNFANQRNFGLDQGEFRHDWVLHLDADEVVTEAFSRHLAALEPPTEVDAYNVPSKTILYGRWLRYAGMYPTYQVRLGRRDRLRFVQVGHGQRENIAGERVAVFDEPYLHYSFSRGIRSWLVKHIRYAGDEAALIFSEREGGEGGPKGAAATSIRRRAKTAAAQLPLWLRPFARFWYVYLLHQGFRDGRAGLAYAIMLSVYEGMTAALAYELLMRKDDECETPARRRG